MRSSAPTRRASSNSASVCVCSLYDLVFFLRPPAAAAAGAAAAEAGEARFLLEAVLAGLSRSDADAAAPNWMGLLGTLIFTGCRLPCDDCEPCDAYAHTVSVTIT